MRQLLDLRKGLQVVPLHILLRRLRWGLPLIVVALAALHQTALHAFVRGLPALWHGWTELLLYGLTGSVAAWIGLSWIAAAFTGQLTAFGFIAWGVFTAIGGSFFSGLWLVLMGWFLQNAAAASYAQSNLQQSLRGVTVGQVMTRDCPLVSSRLPLAQLVEDKILSGGQRCFLVADDSGLRGVLALRDVAAVPRMNWGRVTAGEAMVPLERLVWVQPGTELLAALQRMDDADVAQLPVMDNGAVAGLLTRERVLRYLRLRAELGI